MPVCSFFVLATSNHPPSVITRALVPTEGRPHPRRTDQHVFFVQPGPPSERARSTATSSAASVALKPPTTVLLGLPPAVVREAIMGCEGCRRLRERWTQCRPCAPRSEPPRCGNNGWHRKGGASPFRPGPGGISIQSPHTHNHADRARTTPRENRGVGRPALREHQSIQSNLLGWSTARLSIALQHPRGSFSVR